MYFVYVASCCEKHPYITQSGIKDVLSKETGRDRIIRMFSKDHIGLLSPEVRLLAKNGFTMTALAAFYGAFVHMKKAKAEYFRKNTASLYESQHLARRSLVDEMTLSGLKGAYKYAWQYGTFSTLYLLSTMTIENYRNKISIWEHMGTAAVLGAISRWKYGLKGILVAGSLGSVLGAIGGGLIMLNMYLADISFEDYRYWQHEQYYTEVLKKKTDDKNLTSL